jgi:hypothetical protein
MPIDLNVGLKRALRILRERGVEAKSQASMKLTSLYLSSTVPPIKPYHLSHLDPVVGDMLPELKTPIFLEPKYDGTHILVSSTGMFKHDGKPVQPDQLAGLLYVAEAEEEFVEALLSGLDRYSFALELYGRDYTPMGAHRNEARPFTIKVFEVAEGACWVHPPEKYSVLRSIGLPYAEPVLEVKPEGYEELLLKVGEALTRAEGEGVVGKASLRGYIPRIPRELKFIHRCGLFAFKHKKPEYRHRPTVGAKRRVARREEGVARLLPEAAVDEIYNELRKILREDGLAFLMNDRNIPAIIDRVIEHLRNDHPHLWAEASNVGLKQVKREVVMLLEEVRREATEAAERGGKA